MSTPITWGALLEAWFGYMLVCALLPLLLGALVPLLPRECKACGRKLQRRKKTGPFLSRWFCPFHDDGSPYP